MVITSAAKDKLLTFIFTVIRIRMLRSSISAVKDKLPTFIFTVIRSRMPVHRIGIGIGRYGGRGGGGGGTSGIGSAVKSHIG